MDNAVAGGTRVLVVDDSPTVLRVTASALARAGYHVVTASDGDAAIAQAESTPPDVALVDLVMPTVSGVEVIRRLKDTHRDQVHVLAFTANDHAESRQAALDAGCDDFISKPAAILDLQMRVALAARRQRAFVDARIARETLERQRVYAAESVALLAHDLRNAIMGTVATLDVVALSDLEPEVIDLVRGSAGSLKLVSTLVANLLDVGRFEDAAVLPTAVTVDVRTMLDEVVSVHAASSGTRVGWEIDCDPTLVARFDRGLIERVLHNVIGNARRYAGSNGLVRVSARQWFEIPPGSVEIAVENSGPPVGDEVVPKLFNKYGKGTDKKGQRGLGLYFSKLACEAHGGSIAYATTDGRPVFVVRLPGTA